VVAADIPHETERRVGSLFLQHDGDSKSVTDTTTAVIESMADEIGPETEKHCVSQYSKQTASISV
jgi:hypothetical protein